LSPPQEARCLHRAKRSGVDAPLVLFVDALAARIYMERVPGLTVKAYLQGLQARRRALAGRPDAAPLLAADDGACASGDMARW
jgi:tRNA A-37 threonylcarbamoyl transferase component Bud32